MARINRCPNPSSKNNATDYFGGGTRVTGVANMPRTTGYRTTGPESTLPRGSVVAGDTYRFSAYVQGDGADQNASANINWYSNGSYLSSAPGVTFTALDGQTARCDSGARVAPPGADQALLNITQLDGPAIVTAVLYSSSAALTEFFDGDSPNSSWDGTDGNSTSSNSEGDDDTDTPPPDNPGGGVPGDQSSDIAGVRLGWGTPYYFDDFDYTGTPNGNWSLYNGPGHIGNGLRRPSAWSVQDSVLRCFGNSGGTTGGAANEAPGGDRQYGRWEVRMRAYNTRADSGAQYHPVLIIWPSSENWPADGEYDFAESDVGAQDAGAFIHYPHPSAPPVQQEFRSMAGVRLSDFHNYAIDWQPSGITGYIDGREWYRVSGGAGPAGRRDIQTMPQGSLRIQLDNFGGNPHREANMDVDWVRGWTHTSVSTNNNITATGIPSPSSFGSTLIGNRFRMYLTNAAATATATASTAWDQTSSSVQRQLSLGRSGANAAVTIAETSTSNQFDVLLGQWVSQPMTSGGAFKGAFNYVVARNESATTADFFSHLILRVVSGDGSVVRGTAVDTISAVEWGTTLQAISVSGTIATPVTCLAGDRLVVELGYRAQNVTATSHSGTIRYGGVNDLEANDTGTSATTLSPWINFADRTVEALFRGQSVTTTGVASIQAVGTPTLIQPPTQTITTSGIATHAALGTAVVTSLTRFILAEAIAPGAMGTPSVVQHITCTGIVSAEAIGTHRVRRVTDIYLEAGIPTGEHLGSPTLVHFQQLFIVTGIPSIESFGLTEVEDPHRQIFPFGIVSTAQVGVPGGSDYGMRTRSIPSGEAFGYKRLRVKLGQWQLVNPTVVDRYRLGDPSHVIYVKNVRALTVLGTGSVLTALENPTTELINAAQYVWLGGHANITNDPAIRDLWVANGFDVEMTF